MNLAIVQARMGSTRLPGKVLRPVLGRPLLAFELERIARATRLDAICVATTTEPDDDAIVEFCDRAGVSVCRGSETDVLERFHDCARPRHPDVVVRLTADCPLIDPAVIDGVVDELLRPPACDYVSNALERHLPLGMDCEAMTFEALDRAHREARDPREREHVTPYLYNRPGRFRVRNMSGTADLSSHRWTVDTESDFELVERIIAALYPTTPDFTWQQVLQLVAANPAWGRANADVPHRSWHGAAPAAADLGGDA